MAVEFTTDSAAARALAEKKHAIEMEQAGLESDKARAARDRAAALAAEKEKTEKDVVEISKQGSAQVENTKKMNSERVRMLDENNQKHFNDLAAATAEQIKNLDAAGLAAINDRRQATMEKLAYVNQQTEDPFYHLKSINPVVSDAQTEYQVKVALPEHEAKNLFVSTEGQMVKLALSRRFQENAKAAEGERVTRTNSYQSIVEQLNLPGAIDSKGLSRTYADGVVTIRIPKAGLPKPTAENPEIGKYVAPAMEKKNTPKA